MRLTPAPWPAAKALAGTARPDRMRAGAEPSEARPEPPAYLSPSEAEVFEAITALLAEVGVASATHTATIALAVSARCRSRS